MRRHEYSNLDTEWLCIEQRNGQATLERYVHLAEMKEISTIFPLNCSPSLVMR